MYSEIVMDHPTRATSGRSRTGRVGKVGNPVCGDIMEMTIGRGRSPADVKFRTFGCGSASHQQHATELVKGT